jgi:hypothetical protein
VEEYTSDMDDCKHCQDLPEWNTVEEYSSEMNDCKPYQDLPE